MWQARVAPLISSLVHCVHRADNPLLAAFDSIMAPLGRVADYTRGKVLVTRNAKACLVTSSAWLSVSDWLIEYNQVCDL